MHRFAIAVICVAALGAGACGGGGGGSSVSSFCATAKTDSKKFSGQTNPDLKTTAAAFKDLADKAPSAIKGDMQTLSTALTQIANNPASAASLGSDKKYSQAADNITAWAKKNCGFDLSAT